jgi:hypothetical protein
MTQRLRHLSTHLGLLISLGAITSSCDGTNLVGMDSKPESTEQSATAGNTQLTETEERITPSMSPENKEIITQLRVQSQAEPQQQWLIKPGLLGVANGMWIGAGSLLLGVINLLIASLHGLKLIGQDKLIRGKAAGLSDEIKSLSAATNNASLNRLDALRSEAALLEIKQLKNELTQIKMNHAGPSFTLEKEFGNVKPTHDRLDINEPIGSSQALIPAPSPLPTQAEILAELTATINKGDRQEIKTKVKAQLNFTKESESAIHTGRLADAQLEEVNAGGSYLLATIGNEAFLYPTDLTLKGFAQHQPVDGVFSYTKQPIATPQVLSPARLSASGTCWRITEMGSIAVPG